MKLAQNRATPDEIASNMTEFDAFERAEEHQNERELVDVDRTSTVGRVNMQSGVRFHGANYMKMASFFVLVSLLIGMVIGSVWLASDLAALGLSCPSSARAMTRLEIVFGTSRSRGRPVTDEEWIKFLDIEVMPRFPDGLTVLQGPGQWRGNDGRLTKEQTNVLIVWHRPTVRSDADIEGIRSAYKTQFDQESVMRVESASCVSF